jgi:hypothetical protein
MPAIIISYRRSDSLAITGRIFDRLTAHYGDSAVFMDIATIPAGVDFRSHIHHTIMHADILIAIIGPNWIGVDANGHARLADKTDPVRAEIETALEQKRPIIPVLVEGAKMPESAVLPPELVNVAFLNAAEVASGREFGTQMDRLIRAIDRVVSPDAPVATTQLKLKQESVGAANAAASLIRHCLVDAQRYLLGPLLVLTVAHYIVDVNNLNNTYLWVNAAAVPFAFGFSCFWAYGRGIGSAIFFAFTLGLMGDAVMTLSNTLVSGDPIMPQSDVEWRNNITFVGAIALSYLAGSMLACALRARKRQPERS